MAAAAAWWVASVLLGHERPFFAPVAATVALGVSYAARLRRVGEVVAGVALGVAVGDVFVRVAGTGTWQIALVIAVAMSLAVLLEAGPILVTQAGVQASIVTTLVPPTGEGLDRWLDAVVGGAVALVAAAVVPTSPLRRPRRLTAGLLDDLAEMLLPPRSAAEAERRAGRVLRRGLVGAMSDNPRSHGAEVVGSATGVALSSFAFFSLGAVIPVLPFLFGVEGLAAVVVAAVLTGLALMLTGGTVAVLSGGHRCAARCASSRSEPPPRAQPTCSGRRSTQPSAEPVGRRRCCSRRWPTTP